MYVPCILYSLYSRPDNILYSLYSRPDNILYASA